MKNLENANLYIAQYHKILQEEQIQIAYKFLLQYLMALKAQWAVSFSERFSFGNVSPGYLDYSYFPFHNDFLRKHKLRFGLVLDHQKMALELWLMGQNASIQKKYWNQLKDSRWNKGRTRMPRYAVLEITLATDLNFDDLPLLTDLLSTKMSQASQEVLDFLAD